jgi:hypothetical protein
MAENGGADRARRESDRVDAEGFERAGQRVGVREIELREDQPRDGAVQEEVIPFDRRPIVLASTARYNCL